MEVLSEFIVRHESIPRADFLQSYPEALPIISVGSKNWIHPPPEQDSGRKLTLGADPSCELHVESGDLAAKQLTISYHKFLQSWTAAELGSSTPTMVDGAPAVPFAVASLTPKTVITVGEVSLRFVRAERLADRIFGRSTERFMSPLSDSTAQPVEGRSELLKRAKHIVKLPSAGEAVPLQPLVKQFRQLGRSAFLEKHPHPIATLERVAMKNQEEPLYVADQLPLEARVYWRVMLAPHMSHVGIGRDEDSDIRIQAAVISKHHAEIYYKGGGWRVRDPGSANGVFVEGTRVAPGSAAKLGRDASINISPQITLRFLTGSALADALESALPALD